MTARRILQIAISLALLALCVRFGVGWIFYATSLASAFFAVALVSVCIFHFAVRRTLYDLLGVLGTAAFFAYVDFGILHYPVRNVAWLSSLGLGSFLVLALRLTWEPRANSKLLALALIPSLLFMSSDWAAYYFLAYTEKLHPRVFDLNLYSFDATLRVQLPFLLGQWFQKLPWVRSLSFVFYIGLPIIIAVVYTGLLLRNTRRSLSAMTAFLVTGPIGILFYNLLPAMGPIYIFQETFPWQPLSFAQVHKLLVEPIAFPGPRNAIPSLHMAWVILAWWFSRGLSPWRRVLAALFLLFTFFSTMGLGEHYFVDLVVAVPFSLFIKSLCSFELPWTSTTRLRGIASGLGLVGGWFLLLRFAPKAFLFSALPPWGLIAITVAICLYLENSLEQETPVRLTSVAESDVAVATTPAA
jgi:PAP2 superfamily